jgi:ribosomal protein S18 acetylase RimI-like enzyme
MPHAFNSISPVRTRIATSSDVPAIIPLVNAAFAVETFLDGTRTDRERMTTMMQRGVFLVAEEEAGQLVAAVYVERRSKGRGYFGMLAVDPLRQGSGFGRVMIEAAEDRCRQLECQFMDITVLSLRPELPAFYRKFGYIETGTEEFTPSRSPKDGVKCHCIVMSKCL